MKNDAKLYLKNQIMSESKDGKEEGRFSPKHQYQMRYMVGKKVLATISRSKDGKHFCFVREKHLGWNEDSLAGAKESVLEYFT